MSKLLMPNNAPNVPGAPEDGVPVSTTLRGPVNLTDPSKARVGLASPPLPGAMPMFKFVVVRAPDESCRKLACSELLKRGVEPLPKGFATLVLPAPVNVRSATKPSAIVPFRFKVPAAAPIVLLAGMLRGPEIALAPLMLLMAPTPPA